jgi:hypothetical protein
MRSGLAFDRSAWRLLMLELAIDSWDFNLPLGEGPSALLFIDVV